MSLCPSIPLQALPLRPSTLKVFHQRGFYTTQELDESRRHMANLAAELNLPLKQVAVLLKEVDRCLEIEVTPLPTANQLLLSAATAGPHGITCTSHDGRHHHRSSSSNSNIVTFSRHIDRLLGGGIAVGQVTEIAGMPGSGKTQLATQLCVDARLPLTHGGVQGQAIYVDAEGSFVPERAHDMAKALVQHVQNSSRKHDKALPDWTPEQILDTIHVFRVHDETSQTATLYSLPDFIERSHQQQQQQQLPVKLIVIDSIAFHYRAITPTDKNYYLQRTQALAHLAAFLGDLAQTYQLAVVVLNQMTTKFVAVGDHSKNNNNATHKSRLVPALGESWAHATTTRLLLSSSPSPSTSQNDTSGTSRPTNNGYSVKTCTLVKSPHLPQGKVQFQIHPSGIRDPHKTVTVTPTKASTTSPQDDDDDDDDDEQGLNHNININKRIRVH
jgi:RAD51-like protein 2